MDMVRAAMFKGCYSSLISKVCNELINDDNEESGKWKW